MGINYGFNKVRFVSPVKVGARIRARAVTSNVELKGNIDRGHPQLHRRDRGRGEAGRWSPMGHPDRLRLSEK